MSDDKPEQKTLPQWALDLRAAKAKPEDLDGAMVAASGIPAWATCKADRLRAEHWGQPLRWTMRGCAFAEAARIRLEAAREEAMTDETTEDALLLTDAERAYGETVAARMFDDEFCGGPIGGPRP